MVELRSEARRLPAALTKIRAVARKILKVLGLKRTALGVLVVDDAKIRRINREFLKHDYATDVISFQGTGPRPDLEKRGVRFLGDLVISSQTAAREAETYGHSFYYEFCFYLCHGILHLTGMDDKTRKQAAQMERKQTRLLTKIGVRTSWQSRKPKRLCSRPSRFARVR